MRVPMKRIIRPPAPALTAAALLAAAVLLSLATGLSFLRMRRFEPVYPSPALSEHKRLSDYFQGLRGTAGDTDVYVFNGAASGGTLLVLGGAHANEPGGHITAVVLAENIAPVRGRVVVVPRANASAFSHSDPQEASPQRFALETSGGRRWFRYGSRLTNPVSQWPDPALYINPAGQMLSGPEVRNLNRCYPGRRHGLLTEKIAFGLMELIRGEGVDIGLDIHESAPEYP
ncbi:MAG: succinylglutamate desuccinylase, partial [Candidatus Aminicenantes bacterium]|nr:succinylglutamate desuccinylase [Candidatus Aminicenantes bacterium]